MRILTYCLNDKILSSILKYHFDSSKSLNAPYHNLYHCLVVADNCLEASSYYNLDTVKELSIIVAALFHDFDHSMGELKDSENIKNAIIAFEKWYDINKKDLNIDHDMVVDVIKATEYPYVIDAKDLTLEQKIIRDADLCQTFVDNRIQQVYIGLSAEMKIRILDMLNGQIKFIESIVPNTDWFKLKFNKEKNRVIEEVNKLIKLYEN